ncbi:MAG: hypothetical protein A2X40_04940 [Elusimicrobia bacterium GWC2_65_9]|nr:MAG: hypothetical protein A2X37_07190 [Elusimicrobia bacterium GWA2_66_18]OGR70884.1 MAG: hypothetical protein A2X40_04940 [Elusimicrobia bacterium GWC2_65_9]
MRKSINWRLFFVLWAVATLSTLALFPYLIAAGMLNLAQLPIPLSAIIRVELTKGALIFGPVALLGLFLAERVGFGAPYLGAWLNRRPVPEGLRRSLLTALALGGTAGAIVLALDLAVFNPALSAQLGAVTQPPPWAGLLASFYGAVSEEILLRLGLMTAVVWATGLVKAAPDGQPTAVRVWIAIAIASVAFGLGHLPATAKVLELTPLVIGRALLLNGIPGIAYGWLYWRHGFEAAMAGHFASDVVLHVLAPSISRMIVPAQG